MKLHIIDNGDMSVGLFPREWVVECPFGLDDTSPEELAAFKAEAKSLYSEYADAHLEAWYENEQPA